MFLSATGMACPCGNSYKRERILNACEVVMFPSVGKINKNKNQLSGKLGKNNTVYILNSTARNILYVDFIGSGQFSTGQILAVSSGSL